MHEGVQTGQSTGALLRLSLCALVISSLLAATVGGVLAFRRMTLSPSPATVVLVVPTSVSQESLNAYDLDFHGRVITKTYAEPGVGQTVASFPGGVEFVQRGTPVVLEPGGGFEDNLESEADSKKLKRCHQTEDYFA